MQILIYSLIICLCFLLLIVGMEALHRHFITKKHNNLNTTMEFAKFLGTIKKEIPDKRLRERIYNNAKIYMQGKDNEKTQFGNNSR